MGDVFFTDTLIYKVGDSNELKLTVVIGDEQTGGSAVELAGCTVTPGTEDENQVFKVTCANGLVNKVVTCQTRVKDINPATDKTSVTHILEGGANKEEHPFKQVADADGRAIYTISYALV